MVVISYGDEWVDNETYLKDSSRDNGRQIERNQQFSSIMSSTTDQCKMTLEKCISIRTSTTDQWKTRLEDMAGLFKPPALIIDQNEETG